MLFNFKFKINRGQTIIELILAMGLAALIFPTLLAGFMSSREGKVQQQMRMQAITVLKETEEALKSVRNSGWDNFAINGTYHTALSGSTWILSPSAITTNGFTRQVDISDVSRNSNGDIVMSGGTNDPSTKKVVVTISWTQPISSSISTTTYFARTGNLTYTHTKTTDFSPGTLVNTQVTNDSGGEIKLGNNNKGKWCSPSFSTASIDLPDGPPVAVAATASATSINIPDEAFVATAPTTSNSIKMAYVKIDANTDAPNATLSGKFTMDAAQYSNPAYVPTGTGLDNVFKTNDIRYYKSPGNKKYALLGTDLPNKEVIAVLVDDNNPNNNNDTTGEYADPVNKIFKYWTYFNTNIYATTSTDTGYLSPTANAAETTNAGDNDGYGSNPSRAYSLDNSFALDTNSGNGVGTSCTGNDKDKHRYYNFNPAILSGSKINGIEVRLDAKADSSASNPIICVQLSWNAGATWTTAKTTSTLTTSTATYTLGGSADTWGRTWSDTDFSNANFRLRVIDVSSDINRDFSLDWVALKVYSDNSTTNDYAPHGYGATTITTVGNTGYVASGGYLYAFDLSNIDSKSTSNPLDQIGCRIELDGYDCKPGSPAVDKKYASGETGGTWSDSGSPAHNDCTDGGNVELYATEDIYSIQTGGSSYIFVAVGGGTDPELNIVNATSVPTTSSTPSITNNSCGRISGGNAGWQRVSSYDFNSNPGTEEAANSVFAKDDGSRVYMTSNGGASSRQYYILDTTNKASPKFLSGTPSSGPTSGYYNGAPPAPSADQEMYPRRALTVQNGARAVLVGKDGINNANNAEEYQVLDNTNEATPTYCGGLDFNTGFNDLTSVSELDGDNYVFMVANSASKQLRIIQGGPDSAIFVSNGTFESQTIDASFSAAFNRFTATVSMPATTSISAQVAVAPAVNGSCAGATFSYVGPNGNPNAYFTVNTASISGVIPMGNYLSNVYQNPGRCFRYKTWMTSTNQTQTPVLYDLITNYSP